MPHLVVPSCRFYSSRDEDLFFAWLKGIPGVVSVTGRGKELLVGLRSSRLSQLALRELLAIHLRYRLPMRQLARFETPQNRSWFRSPESHWHGKVFAS